ncbi:hypothetical protein CYV19_14585 [Natronobacterium gregoryi SP2]|uniref:Uncharacterized protein n=1 Tax=Natronobacterium gregoryi (strain ATCC 43098 / DSM 3393 / CCM 3738 / CIP 104747 / IAM 13177 / JCM 8860 / NBRC 102187 / NCIMB 2189 / SP2) TaxID=797304 RepID=A0A2J4JC47_NATGS|nr:hypothetical protein CYV19_14585 [Natronobacterium gregoryi SP2]
MPQSLRNGTLVRSGPVTCSQGAVPPGSIDPVGAVASLESDHIRAGDSTHLPVVEVRLVVFGFHRRRF